MAMAPSLSLRDLRGLRSAPQLTSAQRQQLRTELATVMAPCAWFTIGVMAASAEAASEALRRCEQACGWTPLQPLEGSASDDASSTGGAAPVFLKGNQRTGSYLLRSEAGLGCGLLISGHGASDPAAEDTWGPLPLDLWD